MVRNLRWYPKPSEKLPKLLQISGSLPSSQQPLNRKRRGNITNTKFLQVSNLGGKIVHPSTPPISPISWSFPLTSRLTGQFRGNFLQLHCSAMSQLCCHVTQAMETMSFAVGNASNLLWLNRRWKIPVMWPVLFICCCRSILLSPQKHFGLSFKFKLWWWAKTVQIRCGSGSRLWRFWRLVIGKQRERLANWRNGTLDFHALQNGTLYRHFG